MCRYAYICVCVCLRMCVRVYVCEAADFTDTYVNIYSRYIGIGTCIPGGVSFGRRQWAFDTVDRTVRIFGIEALSLGKR